MLALERLGARRQHIVPWSDCNDEQRLDVHNGLLLSALWDAAFDQGLVSFGDDGKPCVSPSLGEIAVVRGNVDSLMKVVAAIADAATLLHAPMDISWSPTPPEE
jgi:hypothetical protein